MAHPTTSSKAQPTSETPEERMWPTARKVMALVSIGVPYLVAWHMSPLMTTRTLMLAAAQRIPEGDRVTWATQAQAKSMLLD